MKLRTLLFSLLTAFAVPVFAQLDTVNLTANHLANVGGQLVSGALCLTPTNGNGTPLTFTFGGGGQGTQNAVCYPVTSGVLAAQPVVDTAQSNPLNICLSAQLINSNIYPATNPARVVASWPCLQPASSGQSSWCSTVSGVTTCDLDNYSPTVPALALVVTGPQGPAGPQGASLNPVGAYSSGATYSTGDLVSYGGTNYACISGCSGVTPVAGTHWEAFNLGGGSYTTPYLQNSPIAPQHSVTLPRGVGLIPQSGWTSADILGDSAACGVGDAGATGCTNGISGEGGFGQRIATWAGVPLANINNYGAPSMSTCWWVNQEMFPHENPAIGDGVLRIAGVGGPDVGEGQLQRASMNECMKTLLTWMGTDSASKVTGGNYGTPPANYSTYTGLGGITGLQTSTNHAPITFTLPTFSRYSGYVIVWYATLDANSANSYFTPYFGASPGPCVGPWVGNLVSAPAGGATCQQLPLFNSLPNAAGDGTGIVVHTTTIFLAANPSPTAYQITLYPTLTSGDKFIVLGVALQPQSTTQTPVWLMPMYRQWNDMQFDYASGTSRQIYDDELNDVAYADSLGINAYVFLDRNAMFSTDAEMSATNTAAGFHPGTTGYNEMAANAELFGGAKPELTPVLADPTVFGATLNVASATYPISALDQSLVYSTSCTGAGTWTLPVLNFVTNTNGSYQQNPIGSGKILYISNACSYPLTIQSNNYTNMAANAKLNQYQSGIFYNPGDSAGWTYIVMPADYSQFPGCTSINTSTYTVNPTGDACSIVNTSSTITIPSGVSIGKSFSFVEGNGIGTVSFSVPGGAAGAFTMRGPAGVTLRVAANNNVEVESAYGNYKINYGYQPVATVAGSGGGCGTITANNTNVYAGSFVAGTVTSCTVTITPAIAADQGFACEAHDLTTPADALAQSAFNTTSATLTGTMVAGDHFTWSCTPF